MLSFHNKETSCRKIKPTQRQAELRHGKQKILFSKNILGFSISKSNEFKNYLGHFEVDFCQFQSNATTKP